jgi:dihydrofolate synthase/folylpolyglutamate synthase
MSINEPDPIEYLLSIQKYGTGLSLHRVSELCSETLSSDWGRQIDTIHVTGSNGKGSVSNMVALTLQDLGLKVGLFVSPHHFVFNERISVNGIYINDEELRELVRWFSGKSARYSDANKGDAIGAFEAFSVIALRHFERHAVDVVVAEAGVGGRYDPTRIFPGSVNALVSLDLEHTELLGKTLEQIAFDKVDICRDGAYLAVGKIDAEIRRRLVAYLKLKRIEGIFVEDVVSSADMAYDEERMRATLTILGEHLAGMEFSLPGRHQINNAAVSYLLVKEWVGRHRPDIGVDMINKAFRRSVANIVWPGRMQKLGDSPTFYIDVGHSPAAIQAAAETISSMIGSKKLIIIIGVSYNKDADGILSILARYADVAVCTKAHHRGGSPEAIKEKLKAYRPNLECHVCEAIEEAVPLAMKMAVERDMAVFAAGGLFLALEAHAVFFGRPPQNLKFF